MAAAPLAHEHIPVGHGFPDGRVPPPGRGWGEAKRSKDAAKLMATRAPRPRRPRPSSRATRLRRTPPSAAPATGALWQEDTVTAMGRLGEILYAVYVTGCGHPAGDRGNDFGFSELARACVYVMDAEKCIANFDYLFGRAATMARRRRSRDDAAPVSWAQLVGETEKLKFARLVAQHENETTARRVYASEGPARVKSPRRDEDDEARDGGGDTKTAKRGKRGGKAAKEKAAAAEAKDKDAKKVTAAARKLEAEMTAGADALSITGDKAAPTASQEEIQAAIEALSLGSIEVVNYTKGEREVTAAHLFNKGVKLCFPNMPTADSPCFFAWMAKGGCGAPKGADKKAFKCANCARAKELGRAAVRPPQELLAAIKKAANANTKEFLK